MPTNLPAVLSSISQGTAEPGTGNTMVDGQWVVPNLQQIGGKWFAPQESPDALRQFGAYSKFIDPALASGDFFQNDSGQWMGSTDFSDQLSGVMQRSNNMSSGMAFLSALGMFAGPLLGAGAFSAGGIPSLESAGAAAGATGGAGGGFALPSWEAAGQSGMLQSLPGMTAAPGALSGADAAMAGFSGAGAGAGAAGAYGLGGPSPDGLRIPGGAGSGSPYGLDSLGNQIGLRPETVAGDPLSASTMGAGGASSGAASLGSQPGFLSQLSQGFSGNPLDILRSIMGGGGTSGASGGIFGSPLFNAASGISSVAQGIYGLSQADRLKKQMAQFAAQADPNAPYRADYAARLNALSRDPSSIYTMPGWEAGSQAVQRSMAAQGYNGSGNTAIALQKYGGDFYNNAVAQLAALSGGNSANAAAINAQGVVDSTNLTGQSINNLGFGAGKLLLNRSFMGA